jgi:tetratricopeptide repeat protein 21B|tara:strand:+ start:183 stop:638 length:456 start_codon:yes stop_codon:yes gene_type:complete
VEEESNRLLAKGSTDPSTISWWRAIAAGFVSGGKQDRNGRLSEILRELNNLKLRRDHELPSIVALLYFHQSAENIDHQEVQILMGEAKVEVEKASEASILLAAEFHMYAGLQGEVERGAQERFELSRSLLRRVHAASIQYCSNLSSYSLYI